MSGHVTPHPPKKKLISVPSVPAVSRLYSQLVKLETTAYEARWLDFLCRTEMVPYNCLNGRPRSGSKESHISVPQALVQTLGFLIGSAQKAKKKKSEHKKH